MPDIEAGPQSLRDAAKGSRQVAGELRVVDVHEALAGVVRGIRGGEAAAKAQAVEEYWDAKLKRLAVAMDKRAGKLVAAAKMYEGGERDAREDFDGLEGE